MFSPNTPKLPKRIRALSKLIGVPNALDLLELIGTYKVLGKGASGTAYDVKNKKNSFVVKTGKITRREQEISKYLSEKTDVVPKQYGSGKQYQVMEKLDGVSLDKVLTYKRNEKLLSEKFPNLKFDDTVITQVIKKTIKSLSELHKLGVAHADIHTGNIFVTSPDLEVKIIDFGLSIKSYKSALEEVLYGVSLDEVDLDYGYLISLDSKELFSKETTNKFKQALHKIWIEDICHPLELNFEIVKQKSKEEDLYESMYENGGEFYAINKFLENLSDEKKLKIINKFYDSLSSYLNTNIVTPKTKIVDASEKNQNDTPSINLLKDNEEKIFNSKVKNIELDSTKLDDTYLPNEIKKSESTNAEDKLDYSELYKKFVRKVDKFFTSTNKILSLFSRNTLKIVENKNRLYESEKTDKQIISRQTKKLESEVEKSQEETKRKTLDFEKNANYLALVLGLGMIPTAPGGEAPQVFEGVVSEGEFDVYRQPDSLTEISPAWIPFPKGTKNLTFTSGFGYQAWRGYEHGGIDIGGPTGTPIITPISGIVESATFKDDGYGYAVVIRSGNIKMLFGHMYKQPDVSAGQQVVAGTKIGGIGSTGRSTGPHLHWTIFENDIKVNPVTWTKNNPPSVRTQADGGIDLYSKIMVGEAGDEIVFPLSEMQIFMRGMIDEKIKSLLPFYIVDKIPGEYGITGIGATSDKKYASGGLIAAEEMIKKHEALGAFVPNTGVGGSLADFINVSEGGLFSVISNTPKAKCYDLKTTLYSYMDSEGVPTIGFGTTQFGHIYGGGTPAVNMQSKINVKSAFDIMKKHVKQIDEKHNQIFPLWKYIPDRAKGGLLSYLYNRGQNVFLNTSDPLNKLLKQGNLPAMAAIIRGDTVSVGPKRRADEANAIKSGGVVKEPKPKDDKNKLPPKPTPQSKPSAKPPLVTADCKRGRRPTNLFEALQQGYLIGICESKKMFEEDKRKIFKQASTETTSSQLNTLAYQMHENVIQFDDKFNFDNTNSQANTIYLIQDTIKGVIA